MVDHRQKISKRNQEKRLGSPLSSRSHNSMVDEGYSYHDAFHDVDSLETSIGYSLETSIGVEISTQICVGPSQEGSRNHPMFASPWSPQNKCGHGVEDFRSRLVVQSGYVVGQLLETAGS
jgi:hypothetical protein